MSQAAAQAKLPKRYMKKPECNLELLGIKNNPVLYLDTRQDFFMCLGEEDEVY